MSSLLPPSLLAPRQEVMSYQDTVAEAQAARLAQMEAPAGTVDLQKGGEEEEEKRKKAPEEPHFDKEWRSPLYACYANPKSCILGAVCPCIVFAQNTHKLTDGAIGFKKAACYHCLLLGFLAPCYLSCAPFLHTKYRRQLREENNLKEKPFSDFLTSCLCHPCALCQEFREVKGAEAVVVQGPTKPTIDRGESGMLK